MMDMNHGLDMQLFHHTSQSNSQKYASGSKVSQSQDDTPVHEVYQESESNATAEKAELLGASDTSSPAASPPRDKQEVYSKIVHLETELQIIESMSNEVSSSAVSAVGPEREGSQRSLHQAINM